MLKDPGNLYCYPLQLLGVSFCFNVLGRVGKGVMSDDVEVGKMVRLKRPSCGDRVARDGHAMRTGGFP